MSDPKYDVFLSFRGEDTCDNFTSHLYAELCRQNIETFIDNRLDRGEQISQALYKAIEESTIYVIILSEHYASSSWCLDELTEILKCKERYGREVIPVFYKVDPSNVRHQRQSYADDLVKHHQRFGDKVDAWKAALTQVAGISGWDSQKTRPESTLVTKIVKDIVKKLNHSVTCVSSDYEGMTGIDNHIENIQSLLLLESPNVRIIGIWGMGGIGKTTIANAIFEKFATHFSSRSIVLNVQQEIERAGPDHVKSKYLSKLLGEDISSSENNPRLKRTKVLLVFDDVKDSDQLKDLIGTHSNFGQGSRIIVTSRDRQVLENANAHEIYQVREMDDQVSLQLFCLFAFKQNHPKESFVSLTEKVLDYAKGLPLALKVLGSLLYGRTKEAWESELQKLRKLPDLNIFRLLKLSYDGLDEEQKDIFLDIACFHRGQYKKDVTLALDSCGFSAYIGMNVLKDRSLISISEYGEVWMHDLIQEMGHEIVRLQSVDDPGKRSRLWKPNDIYDVLSKNKGKGTDAIKCIFLDMTEIKKVQLHAETFKKMCNLRMIKFYNGCSNVTFREFLKTFPDRLKFLCWDAFPQRSLPDFCPENLVILEMPFSDLEQPWVGDQAFPNLKRLDLSNSKKLRGVPNLSLFPNIEEIILSGCLKLEELPEFKETMENLIVLMLDKTAIKELPSSLHRLVRLEKLSLQSCTRLKTIPNNIGRLSSLTELSLQGSNIVNLPESMAYLSSLELLDLSDCKWLECIPKLPPNLDRVRAFDCPSIKRMMLNSRLKLLSDSEEGTFEFCLTNSQELDATSWSNIREEACIKITDDAYRSVFLCFPGSAVPCWFQYCCRGHSVTMKKDSQNLSSKSRLIGFALCVVLGRENMDGTRTRGRSLTYKLGFEYDGGRIHFLYDCLHVHCSSYWHDHHSDRFISQDHIFLWKYRFDLASIGSKLFNAYNFTFEILDEDFHPLSFQSTFTVKECGLCPLYTKENDDNGI
ncbi:hypothetical protein TSUD_78980 [Trifolium subterraneum]|uniref:ADP-ribosyl cyclase/cyclic ADP-ribose hydrolase n=1 Tax=Trifolium subterraneum TaxID=3900 RepID=A0A2Z6LNN6_TRISU|nr:hypothetical protein TSUD_78980 [Trifolium subterraneum]